MSLNELGEKATQLGAEKIVIIERWKSGSGRIKLLKANGRITQVPPCIYIRSIMAQREFDTPRKPNRLLFMDKTDGENPKAESLIEALSSFFGLPVMRAEKAPPEYRAAARLAVYGSPAIRLSFHALPENVEIGPRLTVSRTEWEI